MLRSLNGENTIQLQRTSLRSIQMRNELNESWKRSDDKLSSIEKDKKKSNVDETKKRLSDRLK